ncbi:MAG: hypothetical protein ACK5M8_18855 [Shewanella algae]
MPPLPYWQDNSPFIQGTTIRATPMNTKLGGISANLQQITAQINGFAIKLPSNFVGETEIPLQPYTDSLLYINKQGDMDLLPATALLLQADHEVAIVSNSSNAIAVSGSNHSQWINCEYLVPDNPTEAQSKILVTVGRSIRAIAGDPTVAPGSIIFFANKSSAELWFQGSEAEGVTILSSGTLRAYGENSAVALISISETVWFLVGDVYPADVVVP